MNNTVMPKCGEVWKAVIPNALGHQQGGERPVFVISNNKGNKYSPMVEVITFTTSDIKKAKRQPTHAYFSAGEGGLTEDSTLQAENKWELNKFQFIKKLGTFDDEQQRRASRIILYQNPIVLKAFEDGVHNTEMFKELAMA